MTLFPSIFRIGGSRINALEHCPKTPINFLFIFFVLIFDRVLPQLLRAIATVTMHFH